MISPTVTVYRDGETAQILMLNYPVWRDLGWSMTPPKSEPVQPEAVPEVKPAPKSDKPKKSVKHVEPVAEPPVSGG